MCAGCRAWRDRPDVCSRCGEKRPEEAFLREGKDRYRPASWCDSCRSRLASERGPGRGYQSGEEARPTTLEEVIAKWRELAERQRGIVTELSVMQQNLAREVVADLEALARCPVPPQA